MMTMTVTPFTPELAAKSQPTGVRELAQLSMGAKPTLCLV